MLGLGLLLLVGCSGSSKSSTTTEPDDRVCEPGSRSCDGQNIKVCSDDGAQRLIVATCPGTQSCADGECVDTACVANTKFCQAGSVWKCDRTGGGSSLFDTCGSSEFCRVEDDNAACVTKACKPGELLCSGETATACAEDGSGPLPDGDDCSADAQTCVGGRCQSTECVPQSKLCRNGDVYLCEANGKDTSLLLDCGSGQVCDGGTAACVPEVCEPQSLSCDGSRVTKCNDYGSAWEPTDTDCAADDQLCVEGLCKTQICATNSRFCQDDDVMQCSPDGTSANVALTCTPDFYHCASYPSGSYAWCEANACQPKQVVCDGNVVKTCNDDGSFPPGGIDCGAGKYCEAGACKDQVCEPDRFFCKANEVHYCRFPGSYSDLYETCPAATVCRGFEGGWSCEPLACDAGETACLRNKVGTCAATGDALSVVKEDCAASGSICGPDNQCAKSATDVVGNPEDAWTIFSERIFGDAIQVTSARKLTEMQIKLALPAPRKLRWVVFERTEGDSYTAKKDWVVENQSGNGYFSSGAISYNLKAGATYALGVVVHGGSTTVTEYDTAPFDSLLSFGRLLGNIETDYFPPEVTFAPDPGRVYHLKVTTTP
jgi:hypothetical protein